MTKIQHNKIKGIAVLGSLIVEFDEDGCCELEDDAYALELCSDRHLGFSLVESTEDKDEEQKAIRKQPKRQSPAI